MSPEKRLSGFCEALEWRAIELLDLPPKHCCFFCGVVSAKTFLLPCYHVSCEMCYGGLLKNGRQCPVDKECFEASCVQLSLLTQREIESRMALCINFRNGCSFTGKVEQMRHHFLKDCDFHAVTCMHCKGIVLRRDIIDHYARCFQHQTRPASVTCVRDVSTGFTPEFSSHQRSEEEKNNALQQQMNTHVELLERILEKQERLDVTLSNSSNDLGAQVKEQARICGEVVNNALESSLNGMTEALRLQQSVSDSVRNLSVRVEELRGSLKSEVEKQSKECAEGMQKNEQLLKAVLKKHGESAADMNEGAKALLQRMEDTKFMNAKVPASTSQPTQVVCKNCQKTKSMEESANANRLLGSSGPFEVFWHFRGIEDFIKERREREVTHSSDVLVFCGYSVKLKMSIVQRGDNTYLLFTPHICWSSVDPLLNWPFSIPFTIILVHPRDKKENIQRNVVPTAFYPERFRRPDTAENAGICGGLECNIRHEYIKGFIFDDSLLFGVKVTPSE